MKNSFSLGILLGLVISGILLVLMDSIVYLVYSYNEKRILSADILFAICTLGGLILARTFLKREGKEELGKGFLFSSFIWGAAYVYLFHISSVQSLLFNF